MQQCLAPAHGRFGISSGFQQKLLAYFLFCHRFSLHELFQFLQVFVCIKSQALAFAAVSAGTSCLLVIPFQTFGDIVMDYKPYIRLVNSHTESDGSYNHFHLFHQEIILVLRSRHRVHTCMIRTRIDSVCLKNLSKFFYFLPAQAINNTRLFRIILDELNDIFINIISLCAYLIIKVRTVERRFKKLSIHHPQIFLDIVLYLRCCCCSKCNQGSFPYFVNDRTNPPILRTEVMSPFGNTMSFVYRIERNFHRTQKIYIFFLCQRLRSHI